MRTREISEYLNKNNISTPAVYRCMKYPYLDIDNYSKSKQWTHTSVYKVSSNKVYSGMTVQGKTNKVSFQASSKNYI